MSDWIVLVRSMLHNIDDLSLIALAEDRPPSQAPIQGCRGRSMKVELFVAHCLSTVHRMLNKSTAETVPSQRGKYVQTGKPGGQLRMAMHIVFNQNDGSNGTFIFRQGDVGGWNGVYPRALSETVCPRLERPNRISVPPLVPMPPGDSRNQPFITPDGFYAAWCLTPAGLPLLRAISLNDDRLHRVVLSPQAVVNVGRPPNGLASVDCIGVVADGGEAAACDADDIDLMRSGMAIDGCRSAEAQVCEQHAVSSKQYPELHATHTLSRHRSPVGLRLSLNHMLTSVAGIKSSAR